MNKDILVKKRNELFYAYKYADKYKKRRISTDIYYFNQLVTIQGYPELVLDYIKDPQYGRVCEGAFIYREYIEYLVEIILKQYAEMNFFYDQTIPNIHLSLQDRNDLISDFLQSYCKPAYDIYKKLVDGKRFFLFEQEYIKGESFIFTEIKDAFISLNPKLLEDDIDIMETIIHEIMHVFTQWTLANYKSSSNLNTYNGFFLESVTMHSELAFADYLKGVIPDRPRILHDNMNDFIRLASFKHIRYFYQMFKREDVSLKFDAVDYQFTGNTHLANETGNRFLGYPDDYKKGSFSSFIYAFSLIDAYLIREKEKNGDESALMDYIISLQNENKLDEDFERGYCLDFMFDTIKHNQEELLKLYKKV